MKVDVIQAPRGLEGFVGSCTGSSKVAKLLRLGSPLNLMQSKVELSVGILKGHKQSKATGRLSDAPVKGLRVPFATCPLLRGRAWGCVGIESLCSPEGVMLDGSRYRGVEGSCQNTVDALEIARCNTETVKQD